MAKRRNDTERASDLPAIARMHLEGYSQSEIAAKFGISQQQVSYDIAAIRKAWTEEAKQSIEEATAELVLQTRSVRKEAWEAWRNGEGAGEVEFLTAVIKTIESEAKLRGLHVSKHDIDATVKTILLKTNLDD